MKIQFGIIGVFTIFITSINPGYSQAIKGIEDKTKAELETINSRIEYFYTKEFADSLLGFYDKSFTFLPEYKPEIYMGKDLQKFYTDWFKAVEIKAYKKNIYEVEAIAGYILEIGNFSLRYSIKPGTENEYTGKYMTMWKRNAAGKLNILSEAFGSDKHIGPEDIPYAMVEVKKSRFLEKNIVSKKLQPAIEEFDKGVVKAVMDGDGAERANEFTKDGIYMPHFDPMQIGMDRIRPYMLKTYSKAGVFAYVKDTYREIFDSGEFVFISGHFKVGWDNARNKGDFEGDMSNLMKRGADGKLLMYRQLAHNDGRSVSINK